MFPERVLLVDHKGPLARAWEHAFAGVEGVEVHVDDFFARPADALVSPANSFGFMDGGLDLAIRDTLGFAIEATVQTMIRARHHGEMPVGAAEVVETQHSSRPHLVVAPTMRLPEDVAHSLNPYLAFRAALLAVRRWNEAAAASARRVIRSVVCPGLGTGIGQVPPARCAVQMRMAFLHAREPATTPSPARIHAVHRALRSS